MKIRCPQCGREAILTEDMLNFIKHIEASKRLPPYPGYYFICPFCGYTWRPDSEMIKRVERSTSKR